MSSDYTAKEVELANKLFSENYDELVIIARARRRRGQLNTMATMDLLHNSFMRLNGKSKWESKEHFVNAVALAMRHVIVDYARRKQSQKRGSGAIQVSMEDAETLMPEYWETPEQIVMISNLMEKMTQKNPRWMRIVDARYFSGLTENETAHVLKMSPRGVRRDWRAARDWLSENMGLTAA